MQVQNNSFSKSFELYRLLAIGHSVQSAIEAFEGTGPFSIYLLLLGAFRRSHQRHF